MSELIQRLRETQDDWPASLVKLEVEAADALEAALARVAELEAALRGVFDAVSCEGCGRWVKISTAFTCDDGAYLCDDCAPIWNPSARHTSPPFCRGDTPGRGS